LLGYLNNGLGRYRFSYDGSNVKYVGVIAQEVLKRNAKCRDDRQPAQSTFSTPSNNVGFEVKRTFMPSLRMSGSDPSGHENCQVLAAKNHTCSSAWAQGTKPSA
jgi:hypothetical protein